MRSSNRSSVSPGFEWNVDGGEDWAGVDEFVGHEVDHDPAVGPLAVEVGIVGPLDGVEARKLAGSGRVQVDHAIGESGRGSSTTAGASIRRARRSQGKTTPRVRPGMRRTRHGPVALFGSAWIASAPASRPRSNARAEARSETTATTSALIGDCPSGFGLGVQSARVENRLQVGSPAGGEDHEAAPTRSPCQYVAPTRVTVLVDDSTRSSRSPTSRPEVRPVARPPCRERPR